MEVDYITNPRRCVGESENNPTSPEHRTLQCKNAAFRLLNIGDVSQFGSAFPPYASKKVRLPALMRFAGGYSNFHSC